MYVDIDEMIQELEKLKNNGHEIANLIFGEAEPIESIPAHINIETINGLSYGCIIEERI